MVKKTKSTKRALLMSLLALLACCSMLIGSTFAWFTDSVSSMNNIIKSGNLDVVLEYSLDGETWAEVKDDTSIFGEDDLWEPGHTVAVALRIKNAGTLALEYALSTTVYLEQEGINVYGETFKLSDYLEVYSCASMAYDESDWISMTMKDLVMGDRDSALGNGTIMTKAAFNQDLATDNNLTPGEAHVTYLAITMPTTVGNEANYKTGTVAPYVRFGIDLYATQTPYEEDSFGIDYDEDADIDTQKYPYAIVTADGPVEDLYVESLFGGGLFDENNNEHLRDMDATYTFIAPQVETEYDDWVADYEVTVYTPNGANLAEGAIVMAGQYDFIDTDWQAFYTPEVESGVAYRLLGTFGLNFTFDDIKDIVGTFKCGVENINAPEGTVMSVALKLYKQDASNNVLAEKTVGVFTYTF